MKNKSSFFLLMNLSFFIYSLSSIFSKLAAKKEFLSISYILCFAGIILILGIYALLWQLILKKISLSVAMANKPIALVLSLLWAFLLFKESITPKIIAGIVLILAGVIVIGLGAQNE